MLEAVFQVLSQKVYLSFLDDHKARLEIMQSFLVFLLEREEIIVGDFAASVIPSGPILKLITADANSDV